MNMIKQFKLFLSLWRWINSMKKLTELLGKLDGLKSYLGLLGVVGYYGAQAFGVTPPEAVLTTSVGLLGVGLVHKLNKGTDFIKKILPVLSAIIAVLDKKKVEEEKK